LSHADALSLTKETEQKEFLEECAKLRYRLRMATKDDRLASAARTLGIRVIGSTRVLRSVLASDESKEEALRVFSPHLWTQQWRSRLQGMGLLSLPKLRILALASVSAFLFLFVIFRLLPSAEIRITAREDTVSQTTNIFLVQSGASMTLPAARAVVQPLLPVSVTLHKELTFNQISKEFIGTSAQVVMNVTNTTMDLVTLKKGSRLANQAGMVFRLQEPTIVPAGKEVAVKAKADDLDQYGEIIGERGNVPAGLKWDFVALDPSLRASIYAVNPKPGHGGTTAYRTVLQQGDIDIARKHLEQELLAQAKQMVAGQVAQKNSQDSHLRLKVLTPTDLTRATYSGFILPTAFLGQPVESASVEGSLTFTMYAYDAEKILDKLSGDLKDHVRDAKQLLGESLDISRMRVVVIEYDDNFSWIKVTVNLDAMQQFVLDPLTPFGAIFGKKVREAVVGLSKQDALRIIKNFPEVEDVQISIWPPWSSQLPPVVSHINVIEQP
jgi:hypothetical protein